MKNKLFALLIAALFVLPTFGANNGNFRPKLIVGIAVDQMRWDYLYRFYNEYTNGGFRRMLNDGYTFEDCQINYIPSVTAVGHTSLYTGTVPSIHGIAGNNFLLNGKMAYCAGDATVQTVGSKSKAGQMSPRNLQVTTIGDELKPRPSGSRRYMASLSKTALPSCLPDILQMVHFGLIRMSCVLSHQPITCRRSRRGWRIIIR